MRPVLATMDGRHDALPISHDTANPPPWSPVTLPMIHTSFDRDHYLMGDAQRFESHGGVS